MFSVQQGLKDTGAARRSTYSKPTKVSAKVNSKLAEPIIDIIEAEPSCGYRTVVALLGMNKEAVQRIFQLKGWQVQKRRLDQRPRIEAKASRAKGQH
ncbi:integrase [Stenotrophomonas maltophilia 5BA-I-2]|nr:integrase [Stenotrophomonas maltophilia 5BA-I-2]